MAIDLFHCNAHAEPLPRTELSTLPPAPALAAACACGAELTSADELADERCTPCSSAARARWDARRVSGHASVHVSTTTREPGTSGRTGG